jgi:hypothetical protein
MPRVRPAALVLLVFVLVGCGGSDDEGAATAPATTTVEAELPRVAASRNARTYTVEQVRSRLARATELPVVRFGDASTPDVTALRTRPHGTERFGEFQIFVFRPAAARQMTRTFTQGRRPNAQGIHWVPDRLGGWIAVTVHGRNLALGWFPPAGARAVDQRWARLQAAVEEIL